MIISSRSNRISRGSRTNVLNIHDIGHAGFEILKSQHIYIHEKQHYLTVPSLQQFFF